MISEQYRKRMRDLLRNEYPAYEQALKEEPYQGFRINTLKTDQESFLKQFPYPYHKSPFALNGWYTSVPGGIGYTIEYVQGLFYMQEPSASAPVTLLHIQPGMKVLDLCAAPGSKSTEIAELLQNRGLLVANEYVSSRADILLENIERNGCSNAIVLNSPVETVAGSFEGYFDAVLVDAPCSGEGMFRKSENARKDWSEENVRHCAERQKEILEAGYKALRPAGTMVYSTCTFAPEENEEQISSFLERHPDMHAADADVQFGHPGIELAGGTSRAVRIYPMDGGEGQFCIRMIKDNTGRQGSLSLLKSEPVPSFVQQFLKDMLVREYPYYYLHHGHLYGGSFPFINCSRCFVKRQQVYLGEVKNNRFEPSHHFFTSSWSAFRNTVELTKEEALHYLHGEQLSHPCQKGWTALNYNGHTIGGGKSDGRVIKNKYPKSLRFRSNA